MKLYKDVRRQWFIAWFKFRANVMNGTLFLMMIIFFMKNTAVSKWNSGMIKGYNSKEDYAQNGRRGRNEKWSHKRGQKRFSNWQEKYKSIGYRDGSKSFIRSDRGSILEVGSDMIEQRELYEYITFGAMKIKGYSDGSMRLIRSNMDSILDEVGSDMFEQRELYEYTSGFILDEVGSDMIEQRERYEYNNYGAKMMNIFQSVSVTVFNVLVYGYLKIKELKLNVVTDKVGSDMFEQRELEYK